MTPSYPTSFSDVRPWATEHQVSAAEARVRFAQYAILRAIAASRTLRMALVFKGGNALDFVWLPNRSTTDLDFSLDASGLTSPLNPLRIREVLQRSLLQTGRELGIAFIVQAIEPSEPKPGKTFITYEVKVGYAFPDNARLLHSIERGVAVSQVIQLDISVNEEICESEFTHLPNAPSLRVSTLEDIIAEKLRALLQQPVRNRYRCQDVLDIAICLRDDRSLMIDTAKVAMYLQRKAAARAVNVSRAAFQDTELWRRAQQGYDGLEGTTRQRFIPFTEAQEAIIAFVATLDIPND